MFTNERSFQVLSTCNFFLFHSWNLVAILGGSPVYRILKESFFPVVCWTFDFSSDTGTRVLLFYVLLVHWYTNTKVHRCSFTGMSTRTTRVHNYTGKTFQQFTIKYAPEFFVCSSREHFSILWNYSYFQIDPELKSVIHFCFARILFSFHSKNRRGKWKSSRAESSHGGQQLAPFQEHVPFMMEDSIVSDRGAGGTPPTSAR